MAYEFILASKTIYTESGCEQVLLLEGVSFTSLTDDYLRDYWSKIYIPLLTDIEVGQGGTFTFDTNDFYNARYKVTVERMVE